MRRIPLLVISGVSLMVLMVYSACTRTNGIDNNNVIRTPFSLYFSDTAGALFSSNDGRSYSKLAFPPDGKSCRAIATSGPNILWAKNNLYYSDNNGKNFNWTYDTLAQFANRNCDGRLVTLNQTMLMSFPKWDNRVYSMSASPDASRNWLGLMYSDQFGNPRTWILDVYFDTMGVGQVPVRMKSLTMLANGTLCGLAYSAPVPNDTVHHRNFVRKGKDDAVYENRWKEVTANPDGISYIYGGNSSGTPLPPYGSMTDIGFFHLGHLNNRLIAIDATCNYGAWYSDDEGANWQKYSGIPDNTSLLCIDAPFEEVCLIGTSGKGLYILNTHTGMWEPNNKGLASNLTVRDIAAKSNIYKNGTVRKFIYIATDKGIYESADGGRNWTLAFPGNYVAVN